MKSLWLALAAICFASPIVAPAAENDAGVWVIFSTTDAFQTGEGASRWHYWFDAQARYFDIGSGINQWLVRPAVGYKLGDNLSVWAGYARFRTRGASGAVVDEDRLWQQLSGTAGQWRGGTISIRVKLLERKLSAGDDTGFRLRFLTKYVRPIGTDGKKSLILGIEPFFDLNDTDWGADSGIAQNRTLIGVGWNISEKLTVETGYMNQYVWVSNGANRSNHLGVVNFRTRF